MFSTIVLFVKIHFKISLLAFSLCVCSPETRFQSYCSREYTDEEIAAAPKAILIRCSSADEQALPSNVSNII